MSEAVKTIRIRIDASGAQTGARQVNSALDSITKRSSSMRGANDNAAGSLDRLGKSMGGASKHGRAMEGILGGIQGRAASTVPVIGNLVSSLVSMGPQAAVVAAVGAAFAIVATQAVQAAAKVEVWKANLKTMVGSVEAADSAYRGLVDFAAKTPFSLDQSVEGFTKLRAMGLSTSESILTSYGNTSAALGKSMKQMIEAVADATTFQFERLLDFGIKARTEGNKVSFTFRGVTTTVGKNAKEIEQYLISIGQTDFASAMAAQMTTISGAFSNLEDTIFQMFANIGDGQLGQLVKDVVQTITAGVETFTPFLSGIADLIGGIIRYVWELGKGIAQVFTVQFGGAEGATTLVQDLGRAFSIVGEIFAVQGKIIGTIFGFIAQAAGMVVGLIRSAFQKLFGWLLPSFNFAGQSAGQALMGILSAAEFIADQLPAVFATALNEIKGMFVSAGQAFAASLQGDFSKWGEVDLSFSKTGKAASAMWKGASAIFQNQEANQARWDGYLGGGDSNLDYDGVFNDKPSGSSPGGGRSAKDAAAEKLKLEQEFWKTLEDQAAVAALLPIEAENLKKQQELQKILGRDLLTTEQERVNSALQLIRTNEFLTSAKEASIEANRQAGIEEELTQKRVAGMREDQLDVERRVLEFRNDALAEGVDITDEAYLAAERQLRVDEERLATNERINEQLDRAVDLADRYSASYRLAQEAIGFQDDREAARVALDRGEITQDVYDDILRGIDDAAKEGGLRMKEEFADRIVELGELIGGKWGKAISGLGDLIYSLVDAARGDSFAGMGPLGGIMDLFGRNMDGTLNNLGKGFQDGVSGSLEKLFKGETWTKPLQGMSDSFKGFKGSLGQIFGKGGDFMKGIGSVMGTLGAGAQMGSMVAGVGKAIWGKFSNTGAQVGGALGNIFGPIGSLVGSTLGGIIGGLFKKTKYGTAVVTSNGVTARGRGQGNIDAAVESGNSITDTLARIADTLGGGVGSFGALSIGTYKDKWRVSTSGRTGKMKGKYSDVTDFGKDGQEEAVRYALSVAIQRGAITGIRASTNRLLKAGGDIELQLEKALRFEGVFKELAALKDPVQAAISGVNDEFKELKKLFTEAGASAAEWADLEEYRSLKMQELMKQETSTLRDILKELNGEAGGASPLALLTRDMAEFAKYQTDIAAGKSIDQGEYSNLIGSILDNASIYGTNSVEYQNILDQLRGATEGAIENIENRFENDPTTNAIMDGTNATLGAIGNTNDILSRMEELMRNGQGIVGGGGGGLRSINGRVVQH
ncbi:hypothetical protein ACIGGE_10640 [Qipengyuania sp. NPDC077410]|uniref:hypothetical protein n=1 Tax=Qipengyuania sp. NPDC077410 TaxID=3364496 RepID=UPI0037C5AA23